MDIYREDVMDHYEHPRNQGSFDDTQDKEIIEGRDSNASCGDMVQFQLRVEDGIVVEVKWKGIGCAITTAAASKLSEYLQGRNLKKLRGMSEDQLIKEAIGFEVNPGRIKCLTLPTRVVWKLLQN
ncbi:iron-sulfur cluster assembly scaffold protein [Candidatus Woesebacteria bacterium]|nr:iron-sulfur cluster assembly scaffold protein [Candidatus Woesebacteria bacterium]